MGIHLRELGTRTTLAQLCDRAIPYELFVVRHPRGKPSPPPVAWDNKPIGTKIRYSGQEYVIAHRDASYLTVILSRYLLG